MTITAIRNREKSVRVEMVPLEDIMESKKNFDELDGTKLEHNFRLDLWCCVSSFKRFRETLKNLGCSPTKRKKRERTCVLT